MLMKYNKSLSQSFRQPSSLLPVDQKWFSPSWALEPRQGFKGTYRLCPWRCGLVRHNTFKVLPHDITGIDHCHGPALDICGHHSQGHAAFLQFGFHYVPAYQIVTSLTPDANFMNENLGRPYWANLFWVLGTCLWLNASRARDPSLTVGDLTQCSGAFKSGGFLGVQMYTHTHFLSFFFAFSCIDTMIRLYTQDM